MKKNFLPEGIWISLFEDTPEQLFLDSLVDEERASIIDDGILIPNSSLIAFTREEMAMLSLPEPYPYILLLHADGNLARSGFRYRLAYMRDSVTPIVNPVRTGVMLRITSSEQYILTGDQYRMVDAVDSYNLLCSDPDNKADIRDNYLKFAAIKNFSRHTGALLDTYLQSEEVYCPEKVTIQLKQEGNGDLTVLPWFETDPDVEKDQIDNENTGIEFQDTYQRFPSIRNVYPTKHGKVVFPDNAVEGLKEIKQVATLTGDKKEQFLKTPQLFLNPEHVDLDGFADRVIEIGEYRPRIFPFLRPQKESWLPPDTGIVVDGREIILNGNAGQEFVNAVRDALLDDKKEIEWEGSPIPVTAELLEKAEENIAQYDSVKDLPGEEIVKRLSDKTRNVLIIRDNIEDLEFTDEKEASRPHNDYIIPQHLKPSVQVLEHQQEGLQWMEKLWTTGQKGCLLADDMGLGKTLQSMMFLTWVAELMHASRWEKKPFLIVAPVVLLENWKQEYLKFFDTDILGEIVSLHGSELKKYMHQGRREELGINKETAVDDISSIKNISAEGGLLLDCRRMVSGGIVLTTYETLRDYQISLGLIEWGLIILDEAQKVKNPTALVTNAVKAMQYDFGICLTGTPVENTWIDLWSIMDFAQPGKLGSLKNFTAQFQKPLSDSNTNLEELGSTLKKQIGNHMLRRTKEEKIKGLPQKLIYRVKEQMPVVQLSTYKNAIGKAKKNMSSGDSPQQHIFAVIQMLRTISLHPYLDLYNEDKIMRMPPAEVIAASGRTAALFRILRNIQQQGEKALIFLIDRKMQRILIHLIEKTFAIDCGRPVNGEVEGGRRMLMVEKFRKSNGFDILVMSPEAAGVGLNIVEANHVIHLGRLWNPAKEDQATDRAYRIGQEKDVHVYLPMAVHDVYNVDGVGHAFDEKLDRLLENKRGLSSSVLFPAASNDKELFDFGISILESREDNIPEQMETVVRGKIDDLTFDAFVSLVADTMERINNAQYEIITGVNGHGADIILSKENQQELVKCCLGDPKSEKLEKIRLQELLYAGRNLNSEKAKRIAVTNLPVGKEAAIYAEEKKIVILGRDWLEKNC